MPKIARHNLQIAVGEWERDEDGSRRFVPNRVLRFERGETVPASVLPYIRNPDALADSGEDLDAPVAGSAEAAAAARRAEYDKLRTVADVIGWIDGHQILDQAEAAEFAVGMETRGKQRVGVVQHAQRVMETLGAGSVVDQTEAGPVVRVDGNAEPATGV